MMTASPLIPVSYEVMKVPHY